MSSERKIRFFPDPTNAAIADISRSLNDLISMEISSISLEAKENLESLDSGYKECLRIFMQNGKFIVLRFSVKGEEVGYSQFNLNSEVLFHLGSILQFVKHFFYLEPVDLTPDDHHKEVQRHVESNPEAKRFEVQIEDLVVSAVASQFHYTLNTHSEGQDSTGYNVSLEFPEKVVMLFVIIPVHYDLESKTTSYAVSSRFSVIGESFKFWDLIYPKTNTDTSLLFAEICAKAGSVFKNLPKYLNLEKK